MSTEVTLPALGESVTEGTISRWLKTVGDTIDVDEPLVEVSTDKVDTEVPSPATGTLLEIPRPGRRGRRSRLRPSPSSASSPRCRVPTPPPSRNLLRPAILVLTRPPSRPRRTLLERPTVPR